MKSVVAILSILSGATIPCALNIVMDYTQGIQVHLPMISH